MVRLGQKIRGGNMIAIFNISNSQIKGNVSCFPKGKKEHQQTEVAVENFWLILRKNLLDK